MKLELNIDADISRKGLFQALGILREAAKRLAPRMTEMQLDKLEEIGAVMIVAAGAERQRRDPGRRIPLQHEFASGDGRRERATRPVVSTQ